MPEKLLTIEEAEFHQREISRRARAIIDRCFKMEFPASTAPAEIDDKLTSIAIFYAGLALAVQALPCSLAVEIMGRFFRRAETMTVDDLLKALEYDVSMERPIPGKVM